MYLIRDIFAFSISSFDRGPFFFISDFRFLMNMLIQSAVRMSLLKAKYFLTPIQYGELYFLSSSFLHYLQNSAQQQLIFHRELLVHYFALPTLQVSSDR